MSAFALPMPPEALAGLPSSAYGTLRYRVREQRTDDRQSLNSLEPHDFDMRLCSMFCNRPIFVSPLSPDGLVDKAEIERITRPNPHLVGRAGRHPQKAFEFRFRLFLAAVSFGDVRDNGLRSPPHLIAQRSLFDRRPLQASTVNVQRESIRPLEDLQVLKRSNATSRRSAHSVLCRLSLFSNAQSFGSRLEPRYIFGAETLV